MVIRIIVSLFMLAATPVLAQESSERIAQLEEDVLLLKRQLERTRLTGNGETNPTQLASPEEPGSVGTAQINIRISNLEEELRSLRGQIEQKDFETRRLREDFDKFKSDVEFRFAEMEKSAAATPSSPPAEPPAKSEKKPAKKPELTVKDAPEEAPAATSEEPKPQAETASPRDEYNAAFKLLNQNQYEAAAKGFSGFVKKHPKDPLVGNAYYWQGETHYIRNEFDTAADLFRQGYESMPSGPKAADNLLKLGMSMGALKKKDEACVILLQVMSKFKTSAANTATKAQAEHKRLGCA